MPLTHMLDTNVLSDLIRNPHGIICDRLRRAGEGSACVSIIVAFGHNLLNPDAIPINSEAHVILYGHVPACGHNINAIRKRMNHPSCVVAIRSLPDVVVSFADHIHTKNTRPIRKFFWDTSWHLLNCKAARRSSELSPAVICWSA